MPGNVAWYVCGGKIDVLRDLRKKEAPKPLELGPLGAQPRPLLRVLAISCWKQ